MIFSDHRLSRGKLSLTIVLMTVFFVSGITFAQVSSLKELKKDAQNLKEKGISVRPTDPWTIEHVITPEELSKELPDAKAKKPVIYQIGFDFLYKQGHIPGSIYTGPASMQQGLDKLKNEMKGIKHDRYIVIYCGCCPWQSCPNIRPAYKAFKDIGFTNVKVLYIADTFAKDWKDKGYPVEGQDLNSTTIRKQ